MKSKSNRSNFSKQILLRTDLLASFCLIRKGRNKIQFRKKVFFKITKTFCGGLFDEKSKAIGLKTRPNFSNFFSFEKRLVGFCLKRKIENWIQFREERFQV